MVLGQEIVKEFDEDLFSSLAERIRVSHWWRWYFYLRQGFEVMEIL